MAAFNELAFEISSEVSSASDGSVVERSEAVFDGSTGLPIRLRHDDKYNSPIGQWDGVLEYRVIGNHELVGATIDTFTDLVFGLVEPSARLCFVAWKSATRRAPARHHRQAFFFLISQPEQLIERRAEARPAFDRRVTGLSPA
jgi:hypothetical protein